MRLPALFTAALCVLLLSSCAPANTAAPKPMNADEYRAQAEKGDRDAAGKLALCHTRDHFCQGKADADVKQAIYWYEQAGLLFGDGGEGDAEAQYNIAMMYLEGRGTKQDYSEAAKWLRRTGLNLMVTFPMTYNTSVTYTPLVTEAQVRMGILYRDGRGVKKDIAEAARWFRKAALVGDAAGAYYYGHAFERGAGVPRDLLQAYTWYQRALDLRGASFDISGPDGKYDAQAALKRVAAKMKPATLKTAKRLAEEEEGLHILIYNDIYKPCPKPSCPR